jgi:hypothetical protein
MFDRRMAILLAVGLVGGVLIVGLLQTPPEGVAGPTASGSLARTFGPAQASPRNPFSPLVDPVTVVDGLFDDRVDRTVRGASRHKNQSKLFFADGSWWGVLHEPASREARIMRLDWATQRWHDTGVVVDERPFARADVLFFDDTLYVTSAGSSESPAHSVHVSVFDYDRVTAHWSLRPDFPVALTNTGVESSVIERADDGTLWVTFIEAGQLLVSHSGRDLHRWVEPYRPVVSGTNVATDQVGMVAVSGEVLLLWSNQNDDAIYATSHRNGQPDDDWAASTTVLQGLKLADNHVNIKALPDGRVFAAIKTSLDTIPAKQPAWDQILLLTRTNGVWSSRQFGQIKDKHTRPIVVLDTTDAEALVFAATPFDGGAIVMKPAPFSNLQFGTGRGVDVIATTPDAKINDATSTKQIVDASTGLVVLASDDTIGRYVHVAASLGGPAPGVPAGDPPDGPEPAPREPVSLLNETSDMQPVGDRVQPLWQLPPGRGDGTATYVRRAAADVAIRLRTTGRGELRPCRTLGTTRAGRINMSLDVRLDRQGASDTILLMARGSGEELGSLRVDAQGRVRVSKADNRETTKVRLVAGRWYRVELDLDVGQRTFRARVFDAAGKEILERVRQPWRAKDALFVEGLCVASSTGTPGLGLTFDSVRVTRIP